MLNIEFWKDRLKVLRAGNNFIAVSNGIPELCGEIECSKCDFLNTDCSRLYDWLCEEHKSEIDWDNDIDWMHVPADTKVEIGNRPFDLIKSYFAMYVPNSESRYFVFSGSARKRDAIGLTHFKYCKLADPKDVEKYRKR